MKAYRAVVTAHPTTPPLTLDELRLQARTLFPGEDDPFAGAEDGLLSIYIESARLEIDAPTGYLGRSLMERSYRLFVDACPCDTIILPHPPISEVTAASYKDRMGNLQPLTLDDFEIDIVSPDHVGRMTLKHDKKWPADMQAHGRGIVQVDYVAGYETIAEVPAIIRHYMLIKAATFYRDREASTVGLPVTKTEHIERLLENYRIKDTLDVE